MVKKSIYFKYDLPHSFEFALLQRKVFVNDHFYRGRYYYKIERLFLEEGTMEESLVGLGLVEDELVEDEIPPRL